MQVFPHRRRGFALLITIVLLAFLVLLLVSLAGLTRVETQVAANGQQLAQARQNALTGLNIALGELQKYTGPDQRVTAKADVDSALAAHPGKSATDAQLETYFQTRNRHWIGVWGDSQSDDIKPAAPLLLNWLVSGNEGAGFSATQDRPPFSGVTNVSFTPDLAVNGMTSQSKATSALTLQRRGLSVPVQLLVGANTAGKDFNNDGTDDTLGFVVAPKIEITVPASIVPGAGAGADVSVGAYAWWIGDEGIKARINLRDGYADQAGDPLAASRRLLSAQRAAGERMNGMSAFPVNDTRTEALINSAQTSLIAPAITLETNRALFHHASTYSVGLPADARHGGLQHDLTYLTGLALNDFRGGIRAVFAERGDALPDGTFNPLINAVTTPRATGIPDESLRYGLSWEQLHSFSRMGKIVPDGGVFTSAAGTSVRPRAQTATIHGIAPVIVHGRLSVGVRVQSKPGAPPSPSPGYNDKLASIHFRIMVVLGNPYAFDLEGADYYVSLANYGFALARGLSNNNVTPTPSSYGNAWSPIWKSTLEELTGGTSSQVILRIPASQSGLRAGEAKIFTLPTDVTPPAGGTTAVDLINDYLDTTSIIAFEGNVTAVTNANRVGLYSYTPDADSGTSRNPAWTLRLGTPTGNDSIIQTYVSQESLGVNTSAAHPQRFNGWSSNTPGNRPEWKANFYMSIPDVQASRDMNSFYDFNLRAPTHSQVGGGAFNASMRGIQYNDHRWDNPNSRCFTSSVPRLDDGGTNQRYALWGLANRNGGLFDSSSDYGGANPPSWLGAFDSLHFIRYTVPAPQRTLTSLAQLQHINPGGHLDATRYPPRQGDLGLYNSSLHSQVAAFPIGNSYASPRVPRTAVWNTTATRDQGRTYDASYLFNQVLWDRFFFSALTYPAGGSMDFGTIERINPRLYPVTGSSAVNQADMNSRSASAHLWVRGAFNVNSTSVEAWRAFLSALREVPYQGVGQPSRTPAARSLNQTPVYINAGDGLSPASWIGFRSLSDSEIGELAKAIVAQVHLRGPFLSLADFVNRSVVSDDTGYRGALQAALDTAVNINTSSTQDLDKQQKGTQTAPLLYAENITPNRTVGSPGWALQADVLSSLAPAMSARSDTFMIRSYGETKNPLTGDITGRAWCEAIVQRVHSYVESGIASEVFPPAAGSLSSRFGRRYEIISFRWLSPEDI